MGPESVFTDEYGDTWTIAPGGPTTTMSLDGVRVVVEIPEGLPRTQENMRGILNRAIAHRREADGLLLEIGPFDYEGKTLVATCESRDDGVAQWYLSADGAALRPSHDLKSDPDVTPRDVRRWMMRNVHAKPA